MITLKERKDKKNVSFYVDVGGIVLLLNWGLFLSEEQNAALGVFVYMLADKVSCWVLKVWLELACVYIANRLLF